MAVTRRKNPAAVALGRRGGKARTPKKAAAVRMNGSLGGRRPKFHVLGQLTVVNDQAPGDYRSRVGVIAERGPGRSEYRVVFNDDPKNGPREGYLMSWWLDSPPTFRATLGRVIAAVATYKGFLDGEPIQYAVDGLPTGTYAWIAQFSRRWKVLVSGRNGWHGDYADPNEALAALQRELAPTT